MGKVRNVMRSVWPVILLAAALRLWGLGHQCLWYDEAFTAWLARLSMPQMIAATTADVHPPTWYLIEAMTTKILGNAEWALRLPSAVLGVLNVWLTWKAGQAFGFKPGTGRMAALLMAVSPVMVYYSQEARMYQLLTAGVLIMAVAVAKSRWTLFAAGGLITVWAHNLGLLYVGVLAVSAVLWHWRMGRMRGSIGREWLRWQLRQSLPQVGAAGALIALGWAPWMVTLAKQAGSVSHLLLFPVPNLGSWLYTWNFLVWGPPGIPWTALAGVPMAFVAVGLAVTLGIRRQRWSILTWLLLPGVLTFVTSLIWQPIYLDRAFLPIVPALALLLAAGLVDSSTVRWVLVPAVPILVACLLLLTTTQYRQPIRDYAATIRAGWQDGDLVFHCNLTGYILFEYYSGGLETAVWQDAKDLGESFTEERKEAMGMNQLGFDELGSYRRLWLVWTQNDMTSQREAALINEFLETWPSQVVLVIADSPAITSKIYLVSLR